jgi:hypothetical protein
MWMPRDMATAYAASHPKGLASAWGGPCCPGARMIGQRKKLADTPEYRLGFMKGHDEGYQKAALFYSNQIKKLTRILESRGLWEPGQSEESETTQ